MESEKTLQFIQSYIQEHAELFDRHALEIDMILDEAMKEYDRGIEEMKQSIAQDTESLGDPQEQMLLMVKDLEQNITEKTLRKLHQYQESYTKEETLLA